MADIVGVADTGTNEENIVGASLPQDTTDWKPRLAGKGGDVVVAVFNPLTSDFRFQHARSVTEAAPLTKEQQFAQDKGLSMTKDQNPQKHYSQYWILKAGETKNLPGDIAQKAVQDLTSYILMSRSKKGEPKNVADGYARKEVEDEIIVSVQDNVSYMNSLSPQDATSNEIDRLNPTLTPEEPKAPVPDPKPGEGVHFDSNTTSPKPAKKS